MTPGIGTSSALDALLAASLGGRPASAPAETSAHSITAPPPREMLAHATLTSARVDPEADAILSSLTPILLATSQTLPMIQICGCDMTDDGGDVAGTLARAAAIRFGRTLLVDMRDGNDGTAVGRAKPPLPDVFLPGLYHRRAGALPPDTAARFAATLRGVSDSGLRPFRLIIVDAPSPARCGTALAVAPLCLGSIIVVRAGVTPRTAVRATTTAVSAAGGRVLGTVLHTCLGGSARLSIR